MLQSVILHARQRLTQHQVMRAPFVDKDETKCGVSFQFLAAQRSGGFETKDSVLVPSQTYYLPIRCIINIVVINIIVHQHHRIFVILWAAVKRSDLHFMN